MPKVQICATSSPPPLHPYTHPQLFIITLQEGTVPKVQICATSSPPPLHPYTHPQLFIITLQEGIVPKVQICATSSPSPSPKPTHSFSASHHRGVHAKSLNLCHQHLHPTHPHTHLGQSGVKLVPHQMVHISASLDISPAPPPPSTHLRQWGVVLLLRQEVYVSLRHQTHELLSHVAALRDGDAGEAKALLGLHDVGHAVHGRHHHWVQDKALLVFLPTGNNQPIS